MFQITHTVVLLMIKPYNRTTAGNNLLLPITLVRLSTALTVQQHYIKS